MAMASMKYASVSGQAITLPILANSIDWFLFGFLLGE